MVQNLGMFILTDKIKLSMENALVIILKKALTIRNSNIDREKEIFNTYKSDRFNVRRPHLIYSRTETNKRKLSSE